MTARSFGWQCTAWKVPKAPQRDFGAVSAPVPTLIAIGRLSPYAPTRSVDDLEASLPNAHVLTFGTLTSNLFFTSSPPCLAVLRRRFLVDPSAHLDIAKCTSPPITFAIGE